MLTILERTSRVPTGDPPYQQILSLNYAHCHKTFPSHLTLHMAAEPSAMAANGDYGATNGQNYDVAEHNYESHTANHSMSVNEYAATNAASTSSGTTSEISKEEVGWYFVEQYYTTLSKSPHKLYVRYCTCVFAIISG